MIEAGPRYPENAEWQAKSGERAQKLNKLGEEVGRDHPVVPEEEPADEEATDRPRAA